MARSPESKTPSVDILMATYNGERYVGEQVASLQEQTHTCWRLLVGDDGSTDGTIDAVRALAREDPRIQILEDPQTHRGPGPRFFWLLQYATADYILFCDQDDVWCPRKIETLLNKVLLCEETRGKSQPILAFSDAEVVDDELVQISPSFMAYENYDPHATAFRQLLVCNTAAGCTMLFNRALADAVVLPNDLTCVNMHDWWLMLAAAALGTIVYVDEPLVRYRQHRDNTVGATSFDVRYYLARLDDVARAHLRNQRQAGAFAECHRSQLSSDCYEVAHEYATMGSNGVRPVITIIRNRLWQPGISRRIGQVVLRLFWRVSENER